MERRQKGKEVVSADYRTDELYRRGRRGDHGGGRFDPVNDMGESLGWGDSKRKTEQLGGSLLPLTGEWMFFCVSAELVKSRGSFRRQLRVF